MTGITLAGTFPLGTRPVRRMGYGAMQLTGRLTQFCDCARGGRN